MNANGYSMKYAMATAGSWLLLPLLLPFLLLQAGCSDEPNSSGSRLLPDSLRIVETSAYATSDTSVLSRVSGNQSALLVGSASGFEARTVVRFLFPAFDTTSRIDSGVITLNVAYRLPDSGGTLAFTLHNMTATWGNSTFRWDSVANSYDPDTSGSFSGAVTASDSTVRVRVDTTLLRTWLRAGSGSFMLVPSAGTASVIGFHSHRMTADTLQPMIEISYRGAADTTVRITRSAFEGVFVADGPNASAPGLTVLQSGVAYRSVVRFDSLSLPAGVSVAQAYLEITPGPGLPPGPGITRDSLMVSYVQDRAFPLDSILLTTICPPADVNGTTVYRADIRSYLQLWNTGEPNAGVVLRPYGELFTLDRFGLYGAAAGDTLRPRIRITYTQFP